MDHIMLAFCICDLFTHFVAFQHMEKEPGTQHIWFPNVEQLYYIQLTKLYVKSFSLQITLTSKGAFELEKSQFKLNFPIRCKCLYTQKTENNILANVLISWGKKNYIIALNWVFTITVVS